MKLEPSKVKAANLAFYKKHPERKGKPLSPDEPNYQELAEDWNKIYEGQSNVPDATPAQQGNTSASSTGPVQPCANSHIQAAFPEKKQEHAQPCDFDKFSVKCEHCGEKDRTISAVEFWREGGKPKDNFRPVPAYSKRIFKKLLEVVAGDKKGKGDQITVELQGGPGYCSKHAKLTVWSSIDTGIVKEVKGTKLQFEALVPEIEQPALDWSTSWTMWGLSSIWYHFFPPARSAVYTIVAESCPNHPNGPTQTGLGVAALSVTTYPRDTWKLEVELKPNFSRKSSTKNMEDFGGNSEYTTSKSTTKSGWSSSGSTESESQTTLDSFGDVYTDKVQKFQNKDGTQTLTNADLITNDGIDSDENKLGYEDSNHKGLLADAGSKIKFSRNGSPYGGTLSVEKLLNLVKEINNAIQVGIRSVKNFQPKIGWSLELEYSILSGQMEITWGDKEYSDHTVYPSLAGSLNFDLVSGSITVKYGVEVGPSDDETGAYLYGKALGKIFAKGDVTGDPDQSFKMTGAVGGEISGDIGFKATVSGETAKFTANVVFGIKGVGSVNGSPDEPPYVNCELIRLAVEGTVRTEVLWGLWSWEEKKTFWKESTIKEFRFPETKQTTSSAPALVPN